MSSRREANPREEEAASMAATLPGDQGALLELSRQCVEKFHASIMANNPDEAEQEAKRLEAIIWKMNGGTFFACLADDDSAGCVVERHTEAEPGTVPMWGQSGQFLIVVQGIRARVDVRQCAGLLRWWFNFHAIDADAPFISETGYRAHHQSPVVGMTVEAVAREAFAMLLAEKRGMICGANAEKIRQKIQPDWIAKEEVPSVEDRKFIDRGGQFSFGF